MKRYRQTLDELLSQLSPVDTSWRDAHADRVIQRLQQIPQKSGYTRADLLQLLGTERTSEETRPKEYFEAGLTAIQLFLDPYPSHVGFRFSECVPRALGQGAATTNSQSYWEKRQHRPRVRGTCSGAENRRVRGISQG